MFWEISSGKPDSKGAAWDNWGQLCPALLLSGSFLLLVPECILLTYLSCGGSASDSGL